jgi:type III restriction enzyme
VFFPELLEYAEVYGVPFSFIPCSGSTTDPKPGPMPTRVRALPDRIALEITFPRITGYRYDLPAETLKAKFSDDSKMTLSTADIPTKTENAPIIGEKSIHTLDELKAHREKEVAFLLAKLTLERYFRQDGEQQTDRPLLHKFDAEVKAWLFPHLLRISQEWMKNCLYCADNTFPQLLLLTELAYTAADKIYLSIVAGDSGNR